MRARRSQKCRSLLRARICARARVVVLDSTLSPEEAGARNNLHRVPYRWSPLLHLTCYFKAVPVDKHKSIMCKQSRAPCKAAEGQGVATSRWQTRALDEFNDEVRVARRDGPRRDVAATGGRPRAVHHVVPGPGGARNPGGVAGMSARVSEGIFSGHLPGGGTRPRQRLGWLSPPEHSTAKQPAQSAWPPL